jgi:Phosphotransferase enzyme family
MYLADTTGADTYRLIVTRRNASEILLLTRGPASGLPIVEIAQGQRIAEQLTAELYAHWGCRAYCLFLPNRAPGLPYCGVMEATDLEQISPAGTCWKPLDVATCAAVDPAEDRTVLEKSIKEWAEYRREPSQALFTKPGWLSELLAWAQEQLSPLGARLTGSFAQLNASPRFSLIRLETNDSAVWFKATGPPNRHELPLTVCIARLFPGYVPELLGVHAAWNGWLTREVPGRTLDHHGTELACWSTAAGDLARLEILSMGKQPELLGSGCMDLRLPRLIEEVDPLMDRMRGLMAAQQKQTPARLTDSELNSLRDCLKQACSLLSELSLPDTLGHLDFNPGNIIVSLEGSVFLDWAEACLTNPLVTLEYLCEHFRRNCTDDRGATGKLIAAYMERWEPLVSLDGLKPASLLSPLVAAFAYTVAAGSRHPFGTAESGFAAGYLRSLGRRMFREAEKIMARSERCPA